VGRGREDRVREPDPGLLRPTIEQTDDGLAEQVQTELTAIVV
jgi:hypothetical protein